MRGFFGRSRMDKPPAGLAITSYEDTLYPSRAYHYHTQHEVPILPTEPNTDEAGVIVLPSIDSNSICEQSVKMVSTQGSRTQAVVVEKKKPPSLQEYFDCFVPDRFTGTSAGICAALTTSEPLNLFHYPDLLAPSGVKEMSDPSTAVEGNATLLDDYLCRIAEATGLPTELRNFVFSRNGNGTVAISSRLRIKGVPYRHPPRPVRRGAKVTILPMPGKDEGPLRPGAARFGTMLKRSREGEGDFDASRRVKQPKDDLGSVDDGEGHSEAEDDEVSVDMGDFGDDEDMEELGGGDGDDGDFI